MLIWQHIQISMKKTQKVQEQRYVCFQAKFVQAIFKEANDF